MPELPEVETLRVSLEPYFIGAKVLSAELRRKDICTSYNENGSVMSSAGAMGLLENSVITLLTRRGKQIAIHNDSGHVLVVQLGMSGGMNITKLTRKDQKLEYPQHVHARWILMLPKNKGYVCCDFEDARRFGALTELPSEDYLQSTWWKKLGDDALDTPAAKLAESVSATFAGSARAVKAAILDQSVIAGVGNIYADESLHRAGINPHTPCNTLTFEQIKELVDAIRIVLTKAVQLKGSTLTNYTDANGERGRATQIHAVYGRIGQPCKTCNTPLAGAQIAQRTTVWCVKCQPL